MPARTAVLATGTTVAGLLVVGGLAASAAGAGETPAPPPDFSAICDGPHVPYDLDLTSRPGTTPPVAHVQLVVSNGALQAGAGDVRRSQEWSTAGTEVVEIVGVKGMVLAAFSYGAVDGGWLMTGAVDCV